jgi:hypothetical protein
MAAKRNRPVEQRYQNLGDRSENRGVKIPTRSPGCERNDPGMARLRSRDGNAASALAVEPGGPIRELELPLWSGDGSHGVVSAALRNHGNLGDLLVGVDGLQLCASTAAYASAF